MRLHLKGKPDFSMLDDKRVLEYREIVNLLLCSYKGFADKESVLKEIWSDLKDESAERIVKMKVEKPETKMSDVNRLKKVFLRNKKLRT